MSNPLLNVSSRFGAKLCLRCEVLAFDDERGHQAHTEEGRPYLKFDEEDGRRRFRLDYELVDQSPELPTLKETADQGCEFCALLRAEIRGRFDHNGPVTINLVYNWRAEREFGGVGLAALVAELDFHRGPSGALPLDGIIFTVETNDGE